MALKGDLLLSEDFAAFLQDSWVPADADLVRLEDFGVRMQPSQSSVMPPQGRRLLRLCSIHRGMGSYVISPAAARQLLDATSVVTQALDEATFNSVIPFFESARIYQANRSPDADRPS